MALLLSAYDLGRQPFGLASAAAALGAAGVPCTCADLAKESLPEEAVRAAPLIAFFLPMHTATRLAIPVLDRVRALNPRARLCAYGLYAPLNAPLLQAHGVTDILGGEFEDDLVAVARGAPPIVRSASQPPGRVRFRTPARGALLPLDRYARLQVGAESRIAGYTEASRGCKHLCRHCPVVPVYHGGFRIVPADVVLDDIRNQVAAGARHITFGDPDFFNGVRHAVAIVQRLARECPGITYDVTIKVEHLIAHADVLPLLRETGCAFVTSAVESVEDAVLERLRKGHTAADVDRVIALCRAAGLPLVPTFVAFTPWTTLPGYCHLLHTVARLDVVEHVAPIQWTIRLLIPDGSALMALPDVAAATGPFDPASLTYPWRHADVRVDRLQADLVRLVEAGGRRTRADLFADVWALAHEAAAMPGRRPPERALPRAAIPYLNEPWYC